MTHVIHPKTAKMSNRAGVKPVRVNFDLYDGLRFWSALTHGAGAVLGGLGGAILFAAAALHGASRITLISLAVFTFSMIALYLASCLYHSVNTSARGRLFLRQLDHSMIYVLIAGTYTPVCLSILGGALGWTLLVVIWGLAVLGVIITLCWLNAPRKVNTLFYISMGWVALFAMKPLIAALTPAAFLWMMAGAAAYTVGGVMYAFKWPLKHHAKFGCHEIFHLFVLLGSVCFYVVMWLMCV